MKVFGNFSLRQKNSFFSFLFQSEKLKREGKMVEREKKNYQQVIFSLLFSSFFTDTEKRGNLWSPRVSLSSLLFVLIFLVARKTLDTILLFQKTRFPLLRKYFLPRPVGKGFAKILSLLLCIFSCDVSIAVFRNYTEMKILLLTLYFLGMRSGMRHFIKSIKGERDSQQ